MKGDYLTTKLENVILYVESLQRNNTSSSIPQYITELLELIYLKGSECFSGHERRFYREAFLIGLDESLAELMIKYHIEVDHGKEEK